MEAAKYKASFERALRNARRKVGAPISDPTARELAERLVRMTVAQRRVALKERHISTRVVVTRALTQFAREMGTSHVSQVAVETAQQVPAYGAHRALVWDVRAAAYGQLANALRLEECHQAAWKVWERAETAARKGTGDPLLEADLAQAKSSLARDCRCTPEAVKLLQRAIDLSSAVGEPLAAARHQVQMGLLKLDSQDYLAACESTLNGVENLGEVEAPEVLMGALHNLALAAAESGCVKSALWLLARNVELYKQHASPAFQLRLKWTIAKLAFELGEVEPAGLAFDEVRREFLRQGLPYDASLAALDLALVHLALGQNRRVRTLAKEMYAVFKAKQIPREASAALLLFAEAARSEAATVESVRQLIRDLKTHLPAPGKSQPPGKFSA